MLLHPDERESAIGPRVSEVLHLYAEMLAITKTIGYLTSLGLLLLVMNIAR